MNKIVITGGTGFIGSNLVYKFLELGDQVNLIVREKSNFWRIDPIKNKVNLYFSDLRDIEKLEKIFKKVKPDIVIHLASYGTTPKTQKDEDEMIQTNILGTINLIKTSSKNNVSAFINTGSSSEYGEKDRAIKETDVLEPHNLYGVTKASGTIYAHYFAKLKGMPLVTLRPFSVYGYYEHKERLVPAVIKGCLENKELKLSSLEDKRDYVFIEDVVDIYLKSINKIGKVNGEIFNVGMGKEHSIKEVVENIEKILDSHPPHNYGAFESGQKEPKHWIADISKAKKMLNWTPKYDLETGLKKTVDWFSKNLFLYK